MPISLSMRVLARWLRKYSFWNEVIGLWVWSLVLEASACVDNISSAMPAGGMLAVVRNNKVAKATTKLRWRFNNDALGARKRNAIHLFPETQKCTRIRFAQHNIYCLSQSTSVVFYTNCKHETHMITGLATIHTTLALSMFMVLPWTGRGVGHITQWQSVYSVLGWCSDCTRSHPRFQYITHEHNMQSLYIECLNRDRGHAFF